MRKVTTCICDEFTTAVCSLTPERVAALQVAGVDPVNVTCGMSPIQTYRSGLYEPRDDGDAAVVVPVGHHDGLNWQLEDLVSFFLGQPGRWWLRRGEGVLLGDPRRFSVERQHLHATPLQWLQSGEEGLCLLDWAQDPGDLLIGPLVAEPILQTRVRKAVITAAEARANRIFSHG